MQSYFSFNDFKLYLKRNKNILICLLICLVFGILIGIFVSVSSETYLSILSTKDHVFFDYVNGTVSLSNQASKLIINNLIFEIIVFLLCLNYYSGLVTYALISYQSTLLFFVISATISEFGFSGAMISLLIILPINLVSLAINLLFALVCLARSYESLKFKSFKNGFDRRTFWISLLGLILFSLVFSCLVNLLYMLVLRSRIFIIF